MLAEVRLEEKSWDKQLRKFSKGMLQRVGLAQALVNDPSIVFLDEPMSGLDPIGRREVRDLIASLRTRGTTVFLCSHILADIEVLCDRAAVLQRGRLAHVGHLDDCAPESPSARWIASAPGQTRDCKAGGAIAGASLRDAGRAVSKSTEGDVDPRPRRARVGRDAPLFQTSATPLERTFHSKN